VKAAQSLINNGDSWGTAFPSSHVAGSVVAVVFAFRGWKPLGWILLVPTVGIFFAVTYLQIHYGIDALAGLAVAGLMSVIAPRLAPLHPATPAD
jgi:membrane-associated phospholipid phosphatase